MIKILVKKLIKINKKTKSKQNKFLKNQGFQEKNTKY